MASSQTWINHRQRWSTIHYQKIQNYLSLDINHAKNYLTILEKLLCIVPNLIGLYSFVTVVFTA